MLYPIGETDLGTSEPKTYGLSELTVSTRASCNHTFKKPGMAWRPPMMPKSTPYWNGHMLTSVHAAMHFQWAFRLSGLEDAMVDDFLIVDTVQGRGSGEVEGDIELPETES
jgi:hypothetical protein